MTDRMGPKPPSRGDTELRRARALEAEVDDLLCEPDGTVNRRECLRLWDEIAAAVGDLRRVALTLRADVEQLLADAQRTGVAKETVANAGRLTGAVREIEVVIERFERRGSLLERQLL